MTKDSILKNKKHFKDLSINLFLLAAVILLCFVFSKDISAYAVSAIGLCVNAVIGSLFPFMILSDIVLSTNTFANIKVLRCIFERLFKISGTALSAFVCGVLCGFPIGAKVAIELFDRGEISKEECERLIGFSNNSGPAFVISGIGAAMRGSVKDGIILYISSVLSATVIGILFGLGKEACRFDSKIRTAKFDLPASVRRAVRSTASVCGFIVIFAVIIGLLSSVIKNDTAYTLAAVPIEVSSAARILASDTSLTYVESLLLTSFAVSFSGISVHMQVKSITDNKLSMTRYYIMKLLQGVVSVIFTFVFLYFP